MLSFDLIKISFFILLLSYGATGLSIQYRDTYFQRPIEVNKVDGYYHRIQAAGSVVKVLNFEGAQPTEQILQIPDQSTPNFRSPRITKNSLHVIVQAKSSDGLKHQIYYSTRTDKDSLFSPLEVIFQSVIDTQMDYDLIQQLLVSENGEHLLFLRALIFTSNNYILYKYRISEEGGVFSAIDELTVDTRSIVIQDIQISENGRFISYLVLTQGFYVTDTSETVPTPTPIHETTQTSGLESSVCKNEENYFVLLQNEGVFRAFDWNSQSFVYQQTPGFVPSLFFVSYDGNFIWSWTDANQFCVLSINKQDPNAWTLTPSNTLPTSDRQYTLGAKIYAREIVIDDYPGITILHGMVQLGVIGEVPVDCSLDPASTSSSISDSECQCLLHHSWDSQLSQCVANCKTHFSLSPKADNPLECECEEGAFWDESQRQCVIDCPAVPYSTGQWVTKEICQCSESSQWNPRTLKCDPKCETQVLSTGILTNGACECVETARWNPNKGVCQIDCSLDENSLFDKPIPGGVCQCKEGFSWDGQACQVLDCSIIAYVDSNAQHPEGACACQAEFSWDSSINQCKIDCSLISGDLHENTNADIHSCACKDGALWEASALMCFVDCSAIENALRNINYAECSCSEGYAWSQGQCLTTCGQRVGEEQSFNTDENRCQCLEGFQFYHNSPEGGACYRSCSSIPYTEGYFGQSPASCTCVEGFEWNSATNACEILCEGPYDSAIQSESVCTCIGSAVFINAINKCMPVCTSDPLSTGSFNYDSFGCYCKINAHWDKSTATCVCNTGYEENSELKKCEATSGSIGAVLGIGGGVLSGIAIFAGMKIQRKKKEKEASENKQGLESQEKVKQSANIEY